jgi:hypothetical protein
MEDDTKDHFKLIHEALDRTNDAIESLQSGGLKEDAGKVMAAARQTLADAKAALVKAKEDLKKHA